MRNLGSALAILVFAFALASCSGHPPAEEGQLIAAYNPGIEDGDVVVCKRIATGTRVLHNVCLTQAQWDIIRDESLEYLARNADEVRRR